MLDRSPAAASVREILLNTWPHRFEHHRLADDVSLGQTGLGLDSIEIAEVVLACEETFGQPATDELFASSPLTIAQVAEHFSVR